MNRESPTTQQYRKWGFAATCRFQKVWSVLTSGPPIFCPCSCLFPFLQGANAKMHGQNWNHEDLNAGYYGTAIIGQVHALKKKL